MLDVGNYRHGGHLDRDFKSNLISLMANADKQKITYKATFLKSLQWKLPWNRSLKKLAGLSLRWVNTVIFLSSIFILFCLSFLFY